MTGKNENLDPLARASSVYEEVVGVVQGGWVGALDAGGFVLRGDRELVDGKAHILAVGHRSLSDPQWQSWVLGALMRAGALADQAQKIWDAGLVFQDLTSFGSVGRAMKPFAAGMVMALDDLQLQLDNLAIQSGAAAVFQQRIANKTFTAFDLSQMVRDGAAGTGIVQTGGDLLYKGHNVAGYGTT